jgi:hypothetical protein
LATDAIKIKLNLLDQLQAGDQTRSLDILKKLVADRSNIVAAKAAQMAAQFKATQLVPLLARALEAFMKDGARTDKRCHAKLAIARAMREMDADDPQIFARGVRYVQMEPVFGGAEDTAAPLRVECAAALAQIGWGGAQIELAQLLADPVLDARIGSARILAQSQLPAAEALLRLRILAGEADGSALQEYFAAFLTLNPTGALEFCSHFLGPSPSRGGTTRFEAAAMALGESRLDAAFAPLASAAKGQKDPARRKILMIAIALLRRNDAIEFLLSAIASEPEALAVDAVEALAIYDRDESLVQRVRQAVTKRGSVKLLQAAEKSFDRR